MARSGDVALAYVTGRDRALAMRGIDETGLPKPDFLVCDVGTSLYRRTNGSYRLDPSYQQAMVDAFGGLGGEDVRRAVGTIEGLELQEADKQGEFKVSYYVDGRPETVLEHVQERLEPVGASVNLIASYDAVAQRGLLDILPARIAKDYAVQYLRDHTGIAEQHVVFAGDSGNDLAAMLSGVQAVVVANAEESLKTELRNRAATLGILERIYFAEATHARGVLEGCKHFGIVQSS